MRRPRLVVSMRAGALGFGMRPGGRLSTFPFCDRFAGKRLEACRRARGTTACRIFASEPGRSGRRGRIRAMYSRVGLRRKARRRRRRSRFGRRNRRRRSQGRLVLRERFARKDYRDVTLRRCGFLAWNRRVAGATHISIEEFAAVACCRARVPRPATAVGASTAAPSAAPTAAAVKSRPPPRFGAAVGPIFVSRPLR